MSQKGYSDAVMTIRGNGRMVLNNRKLRYPAMAAVFGAALVLSGCEGSGVDFEFNAPILEAAGINLTAKKKDDDNLPERSGLVLPPSTDTLPPPGTHTAAVAPREAWPQDKDQLRKKRAEELAAAEQAYCKDGQWPDKLDITEFNKATGREPRCQSNFGKALSKAVGGGPSTANK
jgi:hypothetical protein